MKYFLIFSLLFFSYSVFVFAQDEKINIKKYEKSPIDEKDIYFEQMRESRKRAKEINEIISPIIKIKDDIIIIPNEEITI